MQCIFGEICEHFNIICLCTFVYSYTHTENFCLLYSHIIIVTPIVTTQVTTPIILVPGFSVMGKSKKTVVALKKTLSGEIHCSLFCFVFMPFTHIFTCFTHHAMGCTLSHLPVVQSGNFSMFHADALWSFEKPLLNALALEKT